MLERSVKNWVLLCCENRFGRFSQQYTTQPLAFWVKNVLLQSLYLTIYAFMTWCGLIKATVVYGTICVGCPYLGFQAKKSNNLQTNHREITSSSWVGSVVGLLIQGAGKMEFEDGIKYFFTALTIIKSQNISTLWTFLVVGYEKLIGELTN